MCCCPPADGAKTPDHPPVHKFDCETTSNVKVFQGNVHFWNIASRSMATLELLRV